MTSKWKYWIWLGVLLIPLHVSAVTPMIASGDQDSMFLNRDGSVWGTGNVTNAVFGTMSPIRLFQIPNVTAVATYGGVNLALFADGTLWGSGGTISAPRADGTIPYWNAPQRIEAIAGVKAIAVARHILALKQDGTVWSWGNNNYGQLGDGSRINRYVPAQVMGLTGVIQIAAAFEASLALKADGTVWFWGDAAAGAAGDGSATSITYDPANESELYRLTPVQVPGLDQVVAIAAGALHHLALRTDGTVWTWGDGGSGENGLGNLNRQPLAAQVPGLEGVAAIVIGIGSRFSLALKSDGTVWAWGSNNRGQLGVDAIALSAVPIQVPELSDIAVISAGSEHVLAMRRDGSVVGWGANDKGQLGDGTLQARSAPRPVRGPGGTGQLNLIQPAPSTYNQLPSAGITLNVESGNAPLTVQAMATNVTDPDGSVVAHYWSTSDGQVGTGPSATFVYALAGNFQIVLIVEDNAGGRGFNTESVTVAPAAVNTISATPKAGMSQTSSIALTSSGGILTWGYAGLATLPHPTQGTAEQGGSVPYANGITGAVDLAVGPNNMFVLLADGTVMSWGSNQYGQRGIGDRILFSSSPQQVPNLPPVQSLAAGDEHVVVLARDGRVFAWGRNDQGQIGVGDNVDRYQAVEVSGLGNVIAVAAGHGYSVALKGDGTVWAWGTNYGGQLGDGTQLPRNRPGQIAGLASIQKVFGTRFAMVALAADGTAWATGYFPTSLPGDTGPRDAPRRVPVFDGIVQLAGAAQHIIVLKPDGTVWTGGLQSSGALGFADGGDIQGIRQVPGVSDAVWVAAGQVGSIVLRRDGTVLSWGFNPYGQLGDGTLAPRATPVHVVNEAVTGILDLDVAVGNSIVASAAPRIILEAHKLGSLVSVTLGANVYFGNIDLGTLAGGTLSASGPYKVFVAAIVPDGIAGVPAGAYVLDSKRSWSYYAGGPLREYVSNATLDKTQHYFVSILESINLSGLLGTQVFLGYGTDDQEMIAAQRYSEIYVVQQETAQ